MATARDVIYDALQLLVVQTSEAAITGEMGSQGVRFLNEMMFSWQDEGLNLGFTEITSISDPLTVPAGSIRGIRYNLALELAPLYDVPVSADLMRRAMDSMQAIEDYAVATPFSQFPSTLPIGSGNEDYVGGRRERFYAGINQVTESETGLYINQEEANQLQDD